MKICMYAVAQDCSHSKSRGYVDPNSATCYACLCISLALQFTIASSNQYLAQVGSHTTNILDVLRLDLKEKGVKL